MLKKIFAIFMVLIMLLGLVACNESETSKGDDVSQTSKSDTETSKSDGETSKSEEEDNKEEVNWKIGVITGTVAQNEEEYRAAENVKAKYGAEHVVLQTYPDKFMDEQETVISNIAGVASDPDVKALIICQAIPGTSAAIDKVKELRGDDLLIIAATSGEDPNMIADRADVCFQMDELGMGTAVPEQAKKLGAEVFVHYSFPRHMSYALLATRRDIMKKTCEEIGLEFVDATAPDPTGDAGISGAQQFILEDVPKMVAQYGKNTAFFSTNCSMQTPLIKASFEEGAIYPQPCCPSPYHGFPGALEISIPEDKKGDVPFILSEIKGKYEEAGISGTASTWPVPVNMMFVEAGSDYAVKYIKGEFDEKLNTDEIINCFNSYVKEVTGENTEMLVAPLVENDKTFDNYLMILSEFVDF